jgi:uncharacterized protein YyaL (SSP411 family)
VVTSVLVVLCLVGFIATLLRPQIPPMPANRMANADEEFLRQAGNQSVDWKPLTTESLTEARRAGRPILLLIGTPTSAVGQLLDRETFPSSEIAIYLSRNFTCLRVDAAVHPNWLNAFLPFSRLGSAFDPDLQIWALDPAGKAFGFIARTEAKDEFDPDTLLPQLIDHHRRFEALPVQGSSRLGDLQRPEHQLLDAQTTHAVVPFDLYRARLLTRAPDAWADDGLVRVKPWAWRYLLLRGEMDALEAAQAKVLRSPLVDLLDGGFFHTWNRPADPGWIELEKLAVENAETMLVLAQSAAVTGDPEARALSEDTWSYLAGHARGDRAFFFGQVEPSGPGLRSPHYSVSSQRARESLPADLRDWALRRLGLDLARYPQGIPFLRDARRKDPRTEEVLQRLRRAPESDDPSIEYGLSDVSLTCVARAIETARLWQDRQRLDKSTEWLEQLEVLHVGPDIRRRLIGSNPSLGSLGDYLAYSDARLQDYLATGRVRSFDLGLAVLQRARKIFRGGRRGIFRLKRPDVDVPLTDVIFPEVADNLHESGTARAIRLMLSYGRLLGPTPEGIDLQREAHEAASLFGPIAAEGGVATAGFFCAAAQATDDTTAFCVGPNAAELANDLASTLPTRLIAPVFGSVRPDLQRLAPGIYIVDGLVEGPFSLDEARRRLPLVLDLGSTP